MAKIGNGAVIVAYTCTGLRKRPFDNYDKIFAFIPAASFNACFQDACGASSSGKGTGYAD